MAAGLSILGAGKYLAQLAAKGSLRKRILIIDDGPAVLDALSFALEDDYHIQTSTNGACALLLPRFFSGEVLGRCHRSPLRMGIGGLLVASVLAFALGLAPSRAYGATSCIRSGAQITIGPSQDPDGNAAGTNSPPTVGACSTGSQCHFWQRPTPVIPDITISVTENRWIYRAYYPMATPANEEAIAWGFVNFWTHQKWELASKLQIHFWWKANGDLSYTFVGGWEFTKPIIGGDQCWYKTAYPTWSEFQIRDGDEFGISIQPVDNDLRFPLALTLDIW